MIDIHVSSSPDVFLIRIPHILSERISLTGETSSTPNRPHHSPSAGYLKPCNDINHMFDSGSDVVVLSEHWLWPYELHRLNGIHPGCRGTGVADSRPLQFQHVVNCEEVCPPAVLLVVYGALADPDVLGNDGLVDPPQMSATHWFILACVMAFMEEGLPDLDSKSWGRGGSYSIVAQDGRAELGLQQCLVQSLSSWNLQPYTRGPSRAEKAYEISSDFYSDFSSE